MLVSGPDLVIGADVDGRRTDAAGLVRQGVVGGFGIVGSGGEKSCQQ